MRGRAGITTAVAVAVALCGSATAWAVGFDDPGSDDTSQQLDGGLPHPAPYDHVQRDDTPDDTDYDRAEPDDPQGGSSTNVFDERFDLFGFASARTRNSARYRDPTGPNFPSGMVSGFNAAGAWKVSRGDPRIAVAVLDTGIEWGNSRLRTQVRLNEEELPQPQPTDNGAPLDGYDLNDNGVVDVDDYKDDPRVNDSAPTAQDLIRAPGFSNGQDNDENGYVDDIAGWDFFDDDNDPEDTSSYFAAGGHGTDRAEEAVERGNDGDGSIGVCPKCQYVPMRIWDTFVSDQNNFFLAVTYAADNGVKVILGADGGLYHSEFAEKASRYAYEKGVAQLYSGDDLNTGNHNYPAAYNHAMLVQGVSADAEGLGMEIPEQEDDPGFRNSLIALLDGLGAGTSVPVGTYFRNANTTQFGGKSSISMHGPTGSTNTGKAAGAAALILSAALGQSVTLSPDELRALMEGTAEDILPLDTGPPPFGTGTPDPAQEGFDTHFGYGRVNVGAAVKEIVDGRIPPEVSIDSPEWYQPLPGSASVQGRARARGSAFTWTLEYGVGLAPTDWVEVRNGSSANGDPVSDFGTLPMDDIREALATRVTHPDRDDSGGPTFDPTRTDPYEGQFAVRLRVTKAGGVTGEHRKVLTALDDPTLRPTFPKRLSAGGEAPLRYADLNGDNKQELVLPTEDGKVHVYRPDGTELPGWPVQTETQSSADAHVAKAPVFQDLDPPLEPPRGPTIADLTGDGKPEVITAAGERIYVWDAQGDPLDGWPVRPDPSRANCALSEQQREDDLKHPKCGFLATPALARLEGADEPLDIVVPGLDGRLRAYRPDGTPVPGFPVRLQDPDLPANEKMTAESINNPAIGDLDGDGKDDIVVGTNEVYGGAPSEGGDVGFGGLLAAAGSTSRVYAVKSDGTFLPGWPVKPAGLIQNILPLIGPGHDSALVKVNGVQKIVVSVTGSTVMSVYDVAGGSPQEIQQTAGGAGALNLFESVAVGDLDGGGPGGVSLVKYQLDIGQAANLLLVGQNVPYSHRIGAYDAASGAPRFAPQLITDDYQFLSSSTVANVAGGASNQIVAGTGLGLLHAYDGTTGLDAPGFPKVTGGWLFAPAALSDDGRMAAVTREGFLFEWDTADAPACQSEWPSFRHDPRSTGNYDADGTAPAAPGSLALTKLDGNIYQLKFTSPGDDAFCGTAARYVADIDGTSVDLGSPQEGGEAFTKTIALPSGATRVTVKAEDEAGNLGQPASVQRAPDTNPGGGGGGGGGGFTPVTPPGGSAPLAKPRLKLSLKARRARTRTRRRCFRGPVRATVAGADRRLVRRGRFRLGARSLLDSRPPLSRVYRDRHRGPSHVHKARVSVRLKDGRLVRIGKRFRVCARGS